MAFVHDIEADRIDDFNLFSAFVRVPLLILGGVLGGGKDGSKSRGHGDDEDMGGSLCTAATHTMKSAEHDANVMDCSSSSLTSSPQHANCRIVSDTDIEETEMDTEGLKRSKKMSWSDSVGLRLVEYSDQSLPHEPVHAPVQPRSAMKKCHTDRDPAATNAYTADAPKRYIPKIGGAAINMPSFSHSGGSSPGYVSPEWGWYINTTPPTPEMYHSQSMSGATSKLTRTDASGAPDFPIAHASGTTGTTSSSGKRHHNQVFLNLQSNMTQNMGWTSVPI